MTDRLTANQFQQVAPRKKGKKPRTAEEKLHIQVKNFLDIALTDDTIFFHPNNNARSKVAGAKAKAMGMTKGAPDLIFCDKGRTLAVELKRPKGPLGQPPGYLSTAQKEWAEKFKKAGGLFAVCRSIDEVRHTLADWNVEMRVR